MAVAPAPRGFDGEHIPRRHFAAHLPGSSTPFNTLRPRRPWLAAGETPGSQAAPLSEEGQVAGARKA